MEKVFVDNLKYTSLFLLEDFAEDWMKVVHSSKGNYILCSIIAEKLKRYEDEY